MQFRGWDGLSPYLTPWTQQSPDQQRQGNDQDDHSKDGACLSHCSTSSTSAYQRTRVPRTLRIIQPTDFGLDFKTDRIF